jgi:hypothetical protein
VAEATARNGAESTKSPATRRASASFGPTVEILPEDFEGTGYRPKSVVVGAFTVAGAVATVLVTALRDLALKRHEAQKLRADKFEELVAAVYDFDHWIGIRPLERRSQQVSGVATSVREAAT